MSSVNNVGGNTPITRVATPAPVQKQAPTESAKPMRAADRLELSGAGHLLKALKSDSTIRADKVAAVKAQIESGAYEDDKKLDAAVDKLLDDLSK